MALPAGWRLGAAAINAPPPGFVPPALGVGLPSAASDTDPAGAVRGSRGLQEERMERDAWAGVLDALQRLKVAKESEEERESERAGEMQA